MVFEIFTIIGNDTILSNVPHGKITNPALVGCTASLFKYIKCFTFLLDPVLLLAVTFLYPGARHSFYLCTGELSVKDIRFCSDVVVVVAGLFQLAKLIFTCLYRLSAWLLLALEFLKYCLGPYRR